MELKEYNEVQIKIFIKYSLIGSNDFVEACKIISNYRTENNRIHFIKCILKDLKNSKIIGGDTIVL